MTYAVADFPALLEKARVLADQFALSASHYDETGNFPFANFDALHAAGLLHLTSGKQNGGLGGGLVEAQAIVSEVARRTIDGAGAGHALQPSPRHQPRRQVAGAPGLAGKQG